MKKQIMKKYLTKQQLAEQALSVVMAKWVSNEIIAERNALLKRVEELKKIEMTHEQKRKVIDECPDIHVIARTVWANLPYELKKSLSWNLNEDREIVGWYWSSECPRTADELVASAIREHQALHV